MKFMMFLENEPPSGLALPADADGVVVERIISCETNAACSPETGILPLEPIRPWASVASGTVTGSVSPEDLEALRQATGATAAVTLSAADLLPATTDDRYAHKMLGVLRRRPGISAAEFGTYWREHHAQVTISYEPSFGRYVTNTVVEVAGEFPWDGVVEQFYRTTEDLVDHVRLAQDGRPRITEDIPRFVSHMIMFTTAPATASALGS